MKNLKQWVIDYKKSKDIILKRIKSIDDNMSKKQINIKNIDIQKFCIIFKDNNSEDNYILENLGEFTPILKEYSEKDFICISIPNYKNNIKILIEEWKLFNKYPNLTIIFINENSLNEKRWLIKPYVHERICDNSSLKLGIESVSSNVDLINK
jgi:hypothetical protein